MLRGAGWRRGIGKSFGAALLCSLALLSANAQDRMYHWTDDQGNVHVASDPAEIPAKYREAAMKKSSGGSGSMSVSPAKAKKQVPAKPNYGGPVAPPWAEAEEKKKAEKERHTLRVRCPNKLDEWRTEKEKIMKFAPTQIHKYLRECPPPAK